MTKDEVIAYQTEKLLSIQLQIKEITRLNKELNKAWFTLSKYCEQDDWIIEVRNTVSSIEAKINKVLDLISDKD